MSGPSIKADREAKGIKQMTLAAYAEIYQADLSAFEAGRRPLNEEKVQKLMEGLEVIPLLTHERLVELDAAAR